MKRKVLIFGLCLWEVTCALSAKDKKSIPLYKDAKAPIEKRVDDLLSRMTLKEKILQLNQYTMGRNNNVNNIGEEVKKVPAEIGSLIYYDTNPALRNNVQKKAMEESRLGIPIIFGYDAIHGFRTVYPISLGQACSWNPELVEKACAVTAQEARMSGVDWTFSPMIDVARDPRSDDMLPVKRTVKKYEIFPAGSQVLLAAFYAARHNSCFSIGVITPKLRCTLMVL